MAKKKNQEVGKMVSFDADKEGAKKKKQKKKKQAQGEGEAAAATAATAPGSSGPPTSSPRPTPDQVKAMSKEAIAVIKQGIAKPGSQDKVCFIPSDWNSKFKPVLGKYRKFVMKCGEFKVVAQGVGSTQVKILLKSDNSVAPEKLVMEWQTKVRQAWQEYLADVEKEDRDPAAFVAAARRTCGAQAAGQADEAEAEAPTPAKKGGDSKKPNSNSNKRKGKALEADAEGDLAQEVFGGDDGDGDGGPGPKKKKGNKYANLSKKPKRG